MKILSHSLPATVLFFLSKNQRVQYPDDNAGTDGTFGAVTHLNSAAMKPVQNSGIPFSQQVNLKTNIYPILSANGAANLAA
jgi:hypothetical protein